MGLEGCSYMVGEGLNDGGGVVNLYIYIMEELSAVWNWWSLNEQIQISAPNIVEGYLTPQRSKQEQKTPPKTHWQLRTKLQWAQLSQISACVAHLFPPQQQCLRRSSLPSTNYPRLVPSTNYPRQTSAASFAWIIESSFSFCCTFPLTFAPTRRNSSVKIYGGTALFRAKFGITLEKRPQHVSNWGCRVIRGYNKPHCKTHLFPTNIHRWIHTHKYMHTYTCKTAHVISAPDG